MTKFEETVEDSVEDTLEDALEATWARIREPDARLAAETQRLLDAKTKPRGSLGRLEELACQMAAIRGDLGAAPTRKALVVMGADHGVAEELISAYPQEVTAQMLLNFARGGAAINVLARQAGARVVVVDMGVKGVLPALPEIRSARVAAGTRNFTRGPAMTRLQALQALDTGIRIATELAADGITLLGIGDMGIGNTTASSALTAAFTGTSPEEVVGRGTGVDDDGLRRKIDVVRRALALHRPDPRDPVGTLAQLGGFEIAGLAGVVLGAAAALVPVVVDGFICGAAALSAARIAPVVAGSLIAAHRSVEAGHRAVLKAIGQRPLLDLDLRLGEGTGAVLAMNLVDAALAIVREMATFASAGVSERAG
jgi:nicotinate-nucleotide--dimethylbenzimidazole phosphoribosyltransferase